MRVQVQVLSPALFAFQGKFFVPGKATATASPGAPGRRSARVSDPAETRDRRSPAARLSARWQSPSQDDSDPGAPGRRSARVSDPAETRDRRSPAARLSARWQSPSQDDSDPGAGATFGAGLRPRRNARPKSPAARLSARWQSPSQDDSDPGAPDAYCRLLTSRCGLSRARCRS